MTQPIPNTRMPWFRFFWKDHAVKTSRLTWAERGFLEAARLELAGVEGCRLPMTLLMQRLRVLPESEDAKHMETLLVFSLLSQDGDEVWADDLVAEHANAVHKSAANAEKGRAGGNAKAKAKALQPDPTDF